MPGLLALGELAPVEHALSFVLFPDPASGLENRGGEAVLTEQRQGLGVKIAVPVVKSEHHGPRWQVTGAVGENRGQRSRGERGEAGFVQVGELISEDVRGDREWVRGGRNVSDLVIHQNGDPER